MAKDATLEALRVAQRKLEQKLVPFEQLPARLARLERLVTVIDQRVAGLLGKPPTAAALVPQEPEPVPAPVQLQPAGITAEDIGLALRSAVTELGTQLSAVLREVVTPPAPPKPPRANGTPKPTSEDLGELGIAPGSVVAFEQPRG